MLLIDVIKALFYACSSYPKVAAPHRLYPSEDYEICILSTLIPAVSLYSHVANIVSEFRRGDRSIGSLEIGKTMARGISIIVQDMGFRANVALAMHSALSSYLDALTDVAVRDFREALRRLYQALLYVPADETSELIKVLRSVGGEYARVLDLLELSERRAVMEGMNLADLFSLMARHMKVFEPLANQQKVLSIIASAENYFKITRNINTALSLTFIETVREALPQSINLAKAQLQDLLKLDISYRKAGKDLSYAMPYIIFASLYLVKSAP